MKINKINKIKTNNYGFGHMEIILVVLVVAIIGVVGFTVFNSNSSKKTSAITSTKSLVATAKPPGHWAILGTQNIKNSTMKLWACAQYTPWGSTAAWTIKEAMTQSNPNSNIRLNSFVTPGSGGSSVQSFNKTVNGSFYFLPDKLINPKNLDYLSFIAYGSTTFIVSDIGGDPKVAGFPGYGAFGNPLYTTTYYISPTVLKPGPKGALPSCY